MNDISLTILPEMEGDAAAIERLHERTFGPGRYAKTAYRLRENVAHRLEVSFTAHIGTLLVGSVRFLRYASVKRRRCFWGRSPWSRPSASAA